jgi:hypothetical protein
MNLSVLDNIPLHINTASLKKLLRIGERNEYSEGIEDLVCAAQSVARPKAIYAGAFVESRNGDSVVIEGITFTSRVLRVNLEQTNRVFPFVATCGVELEEWSNSIEGMLNRYCADQIKELALEAAAKALEEDVATRYAAGCLAMMNPGSLPDWPVSEQRNLFGLLGEAAGKIGVRLTEGCVMFPVKSVSGILFPSEEGFESCQLCARQCPKRRAPYDEGLYERKYRGQESAT